MADQLSLRNAVERIEWYMLEQSRHLLTLQLHNQDLKQLPDEIVELEEFEALDLSNNTGIDLSENLTNLTNLKVLSLLNCELDTVPAAVMELKSLEGLNLIDNRNITLPDEMANLSNLQVLLLVNCNLHTLPNVVLKLSGLLELDLSKNHHISLPDDLYRLSTLQILKLRYVNLVTVPSAVLKLSQLEELNLSYNNRIHLPGEMVGLTNIRVLKLQRIDMVTVPPVVLELKQLEWLDLSSNPLQTLPNEIGQLTNIKHLELCDCLLQTLPGEIGQLTNMKNLHLSRCQLHTLPPGVWGLIQLEWLDLGSNPLQAIPKEIGKLTSVKYLDLSNCRLNTLPSEVGRLTKLEWLELRSNPVQTLPVEFRQLVNLSYLNVSTSELVKPPPEVCKGGIKAIKQYFDEIERTEENVSAHLKVVVLGEKMAGKTSLVRTLGGGVSIMTEEEDRTHCVEITQWAPDDSITFEVYDFGGHDVYHLTHQFFLTPVAFYLLLVNLQTYSCNEQGYAEAVGFWLDTLNARVPGAVVSLVGSKKDLCRRDDVKRKTRDIHERVNQQMALWERHLKQQIKTLVSMQKMHKGVPPKSEKDITKKLKHANHLLSQRLRIVGDVHHVSVKPKSRILTIFSISSSSSSYMKLKVFLLKTARDTTLFPTLRRILPKSWVDFEQQLQNQGLPEAPEPDKSKSFVQTSQLEEIKQPTQYRLTMTDCVRLGSLAGLSSDSLETVLSYLQQVGTILRYTDIPELKDLIFHDPPALIEIFKDLFYHDIDTLFSTTNPKLDRFTSPQLSGFRSDLRDRGLIKKEVMTCLLPPDINPGIVTALMQNFGLCFEIQAKDKTDPSKHIAWYRIPWYLRTKMPESLKTVWSANVPVEEEQLQLMCDIRGFCPRGLFQRFSVGIHPLVDDRTDWKDGLMAYRQDYPVMVSSKPVADDTYIIMATRGSLAQADEMWGVVHPLLEVLVQLLQEWPGVLYSLHVTCAHCIKAGLDNPHQYPLRDRTVDDGRDVRCPGVMHTASTSADLVYRPGRFTVGERRTSLTPARPLHNEHDCYKMTSDPRGLALIISNTNLTDQTRKRLGGEKDLDTLKTICEKLKLRPEIRVDLTAQQIEAVAKDASMRDHSDYDCFVLFLLSHGAEKGVLGTDGQHVSEDSIISNFQACDSLVGKPKLFFIQACRGVDMDKGLEQTETTTGEESGASQAGGAEASDGTTKSTESPPTTAPATSAAPLESPDAGERTIPSASDRLVMHATVHGHVSWRNSKTGTWLIQVLADVITEHAETETLLEMLTRVNAKVADFKASYKNQEYKQQPEVTHTLRKKLYFFPEAAVEQNP